jgi:hypothetical protein
MGRLVGWLAAPLSLGDEYHMCLYVCVYISENLCLYTHAFLGPQPQRVGVLGLRLDTWHLDGGGTHHRP